MIYRWLIIELLLFKQLLKIIPYLEELHLIFCQTLGYNFSSYTVEVSQLDHVSMHLKIDRLHLITYVIL